MDAYDILIIGGGQAGIPLARRLAGTGKRVALAERRHLGGSCVNFGCTPTKAVLASARVARLARRGREFGIDVAGVTPDFPAVLRRARGIVADSVQGLRRGLDDCRATVLAGHARFAGRDGEGFRLTVTGDGGPREVTARRVVVNTGTRTAVPPVEGIDAVPFLHAGNWLDAETLPEKLVVVGAGYVGLEMAQFYRAMGSDVCVVGSGGRVAGREDADVADALKKLLQADGVTFRMHARAVSVKADAAGGLSLTVRVDDGTRVADDQVIAGSHLFLATGRTANTDDLGLDTIGLEPGRGGVLGVDERLATAVPGVWAAGDVRGGPMFTHASWDDHRVLESQLLGDGARTTRGRLVPYAIFTDPELGRVGLSEAEARERFGDAIRVATFDMSHNGKAVQQGEPAGFVKVIADARTDRLLGAAVLAGEGAELVATYVTLMNSGVSLAAVCRGIYVHPTLSEALQSAVGALDLGLPAENVESGK